MSPILRRAALALPVVLSSGLAAAACSPTHTIQRGDTLSAIALDNLGSLFDFVRIHEANRDVIGDNPDLIFPGDVLTIPCDFAVMEELDWSVMPSPEAIASLMKQADIQVLDIRAADAVAESGVVPGSVSIPYGAWRGPSENPGSPPDEATLEAAIGAAGLDLAGPILIVHSKDNPMATGRAARVYWLLKSSGGTQLAILRGGFDGWRDANLPVDRLPATPEPALVDIAFSDEWRADKIDVYGIADGQIDGHLLDARPHGMFARLDDMGRAMATTLPGARNAPAPPLMSLLAGEADVEAGAWRVVEYLKDHDADWESGPVVSFCHTGELGALNWFYASELAGLPRMQLYPDSIVGWTSEGGTLVPGASEG